MHARSLLRFILTLTFSAVVCLSFASGADEEWQAMLATNDAGLLPGWAAYTEDKAVPAGDVWKFSDGRLFCQGAPKGYIYTEKDYLDFVLRLEWRWTSDKRPANGGVLIRMTGPHKIWPKSLEAQINAGDAGDFWGLDGYKLSGPSDRSKSLNHTQFGTLTNVRKMRAMEKPSGQWNTYEITANNDVVTLKINGSLVNRATGCDVVPGKICLTAEGNEIEFRQVMIRSLDDRPQ